VKHSTCSFDNKCEKLWIAVYNQSATVMYMPVRHYKTISRCATLLWKLPEDWLELFVNKVLCFTLQQWPTCVSVTPSADPQSWSLHINNIETETAINDIIASDECQALLWDPTVDLFGFPAQVNTVRAEKLHACPALDISNIRPLGSVGCIRFI